MRSVNVHPKWYELSNMADLTEYLHSIPSHELTKKVATEISEQHLLQNPRRMVVESFIQISKEFMLQLFDEIKLDLDKHSIDYPFLKTRIPFVRYESTEGRRRYHRIQERLRKVPGYGRRFLPRPIKNPVVSIVLPGVDYSAESLISSFSIATERLPDKSQLGWQHLDAWADYCLDMMTLGREAYASLIDAWYYENDSDAYFQGLETIAEEMLHHISDEIAGPRYGEKSIEREHYWMKSYGEFPEKIDIALLRLKDDYLGRMKLKFEK